MIPDAEIWRATLPLVSPNGRFVKLAVGTFEGAQMRVLVVEDEVLIAMEMADALADMGYDVVGPASDVQKALTLANAEKLDAALLDVNLHGQSAEPVATLLDRRGIPFAVVTGYYERVIAAAFRNRPLVPKPFTRADISEVVRTLATR